MGRKISKEEKINLFKKIIVTGFFLGYMPVAPATFSCLISIVIWYFLIPSKVIYILVAGLIFLVGILLSHNLVEMWGKDPRRIVIDEYASFLLPLYFTPKAILPLVIAFVLFRIFDILKPPPIKKLEHLPGGWGVMLDDFGAAVYATIVILIIQQLRIVV